MAQRFSILALFVRCLSICCSCLFVLLCITVYFYLEYYGDLLRDNKKDSKALFYIFQAVHESIFPRVAVATKSKKPWDTLETSYQGMEKVKTTKLQMLRRDFGTLCMKEYDNIDSFFTQVKGNSGSY